MSLGHIVGVSHAVASFAFQMRRDIFKFRDIFSNCLAIFGANTIFLAAFLSRHQQRRCFPVTCHTQFVAAAKSCGKARRGKETHFFGSTY